MAQDVASAVRTFKGEVYYDTTVGIPYFSYVLGHWPPLSLIKAYFNAAAFTVQDVVSSKSFLTYNKKTRQLGGQIHVTLPNSTTLAVNF